MKLLKVLVGNNFLLNKQGSFIYLSKKKLKRLSFDNFRLEYFQGAYRLVKHFSVNYKEP